MALTGAALLALWSARISRRDPMSGADPTTSQFSGSRALRPVIVATWLYGVGSPLLGLIQLGRQGNGIGVAAAVTPLQSHFSTALSAVVAFLCLRTIFIHDERQPRRSGLVLVAYLLPWIALEVVSAIYAGYASGRQFFLYPLVAVAFWVAAPGLRVLRVLGYLVVVTAAFSIVFGLVSRTAFVDAGAAGIDKAIIGHGPLLLAGPFNASNTLGLALALGLPAVTALPSARLRILGLALAETAVLWSASRTSILASVMVLLLYAISRFASPRAFQGTALLAIAAGAGLTVLTPFLNTNPYEFSSRGFIWIASRTVWHHHLWVGAGPKYYERPNNLGFFALYGHNLVLDSLVRGGLVAGFSIAVWYVTLAARGLRESRQVLAPLPALVAVAVIYTSWLEVPLDFSNLGLLGFSAWITTAAIFFSHDRDPDLLFPQAVPLQ